MISNDEIIILGNFLILLQEPSEILIQVLEQGSDYSQYKA